MLFPIHDDNPRSCVPWLAWGLLGSQVLVTLMALGVGASDSWWTTFGVPPSSSAQLLPFLYVPLVAYCLFQWGFLWVMADNIEDRLGRVAFGSCCAMIGTIGVLVQSAAENRVAPGGFAQCLLAFTVVGYAMLFPRRGVTFRVVGLSARRNGLFSEFHVPAWGAMSFWLLIQVLVTLIPVTASAPLAGLVGAVGGALIAMRWRDPQCSSLWASWRSFGSSVFLPAGRPGTDGAASITDSGSQAPAAILEVLGPLTPERAPVTTRTVGAAQPLSYLEPETPAGAGEIAEAPTPVAAELENRYVWTVIRTTDELLDLAMTGRAIARVTGELLYAVTQRLRVTRGLLAYGLEEAPARELAATLAQAGIQVSVARWSEAVLPTARLAQQVAWTERSLAFVLRDGSTHDYPWRRVQLVTGYQLEQLTSPHLLGDEVTDKVVLGQTVRRDHELLDFFFGDLTSDSPPLRVRVHQAQTHYPGGEPGGRRQLARAVLTHRTRPVTNSGVEVLAGHGSWGHLRFGSEQQLDLYVAWLLLRARSTATKAGADPTGTARYLE
ncbi:MAG: rhomboid family intramembrane serine protease [Planctomycetota bacterium]